IVRQEMAKLIEPIEEMFYKDTENVVGIRATIAVSRRGGQVKENEASILAELTPADTRKTSLNELMKTWKEKTSDLEGIKKVKFLRGRWGRDSGSAVEIQIQENNDKTRSAVANTIKKYLEGKEYTADVEIDRPIMKREYIFKLNQDKLVKLNVNPLTVTRTLRAFVEGIVLYSINKGEEEIDVKITVDDNFKTDLNTLLDLKVENNQGLLIKLVDIATLEEMERPISIQRANFKRASSIFGNLKEKVKVTPLEIADDLEKNLFPEIYSNFPTTILEFKGEIKDSRESQGEFTNSVLIALLMIYMLLVIMFDSMYKPFIVLSIVPFGLAGIAYVLLLHGMSVYGFFAAIGALGMLGVVINDAIVMVNKIELNILSSPEDRLEALVQGAATRLRPILLTTFTTVVGVLPTAYGFAGYDSILAEMMLTMGWGLAVGTCVTLLLIPCIYSFLLKEKRVELIS
ncbi:efflux RND transporter permease subunit, partial [Bacteriovoracaceae bacterium]|nr:efflux RND transporter permease subunit [Bacteriovoracaceae bacterium]